MKKYFICVTDCYGQRTGEVRTLHLKKEEISTDRFGNLMHNGRFLYDNALEANRAALN